ncbi:hypothetical protein E3E12_04615 [Formicincola oecophyllae]|uniref:Lipoprotein n=1 Tax=Formicincola oecophyllae TaxID=2558361 RepID=A0A4Y6U8R9_9PROT|nr:hypothetical protein [Formicincola oecophyllae]QDH13594.2 hypothetical protein E3E12_04615 [Formicincola oecophyllae]
MAWRKGVESKRSTSDMGAAGALALTLLFGLGACGQAGTQNSRQAGDFMSNHPLGCAVLLPFCPMIEAYTMMPQSAPPDQADPVFSTRQAMNDCADRYSTPHHAEALASCQNSAFAAWASKGGMSSQAIQTVTAANTAQGAAVQKGQRTPLQAQLTFQLAMEQAVAQTPVTYPSNPAIVPNSLLAWEKHQCGALYGGSKQEYVYEAMCDNVALAGWARRTHTSQARLQPLMDGALQVAYQEQSQKISHGSAEATLAALVRKSGLDFTVPANTSVIGGKGAQTTPAKP